MGNLGGIMGNYGGIMGNYGGIMGEFWGIWVQLWGIMGNYGGIMGNGGGIMGNYGEFWGIVGELWWNYGELWGVMVELWVIMGHYGELWDVISCVADRCFLSSYGPLLPQTCQTFILTTTFFMCDSPTCTRPPRNISQGQLAKQMKKLNIKTLNPTDIGLSVAGGRRGGAWMSCAAALNVVPPGHRAACASAFAEAATAAGLPATGTSHAAADGWCTTCNCRCCDCGH